MKLSKEELIKQFKKIHGDKYDYSKVEYVNTDTKVIIICQKHGEFQQTPDKHKSGQSCPKCRGLGRLTTEEVIQQFKEVHRDRYDYSEVKYKNVDSKVIIKCKEHGIFLQSPYNHRKGKGCPKCSGAGLSREEIIEQFRKVHGNKYDYSKMEFVNTRSFITVICPEHGEFRQIANSHKQGNGCPKCSGTLKLTQNEIIEEFRNIHGNRYDYSKVDYKNANAKVIIICPEHGEFKQTPSSHKHGSGCPKCLGMGASTEEIIQQFKAAHGDIYDYSKVKYLNNNEEVIIICKVHGSFLQIPRIHKLGSGCPKCAGRGFSTEEIIEQFRKRHGGKYDYSKVEYSDARIPVTIICPEHGIFLQTSDSHKRGSGCPKCSGRGFSTEEIVLGFKKVHGDKYDYSKVKYEKSSSKVIIICPEHGEFLQSPDIHKQGVGCPKCAGTKKLTQEEIIKAFEEKHSSKYDYSKVKYINIDTKVIIICPMHGEFVQTPNIHKNGGGCPTCNQGWSKTKILEFLHTIENQDLLQMDAVELQMIINQGKLPEVFRELVFTDGENKENTLKALKEKLRNSLEDEVTGEPLSAESKEEDWNQDEAEQEDLEISEETDSLIETEKQKLLSLSEKNEDLHMLDHNLVSSCDGEAIEFLIQYKLRKIWNKVLNNEFSVDHFRTETGGANFTLLQKYFFEEYNQVQKYSPPAGYCFPYEPNLMQKLTVFRLLKHQRYGNWSGTGAGKTISFILASRSIDARLTVLIGLNSTIGQLKETILQVYPDSRVETYYKPGNIFDRNFRNYLILNYDKFQQEYSEELFQDLTDSNQIDFIAIDEIHNAKQRTAEQESKRRGTIKRLIGRAAENNKELYVLGMSATPVINNLTEAKSLLEMVTGREYSDFSTLKTLSNAMDAFKHLSLNGLRYIPKYNIQIKELTGENTEELKIDGKGLVDQLLSVSSANYSKAEQILLSDKLSAVRPYLRSGVILYSYFTTGMTDKIADFVKLCGFKAGTYTGDEPSEEREETKNNFLQGKIDILIGSRPVGTGVDGLQEKCSRMIILSLPWTDSEYTQLKGRIYRQGSKFGEVEIIIPQVFIILENKEWSWDLQRIHLIRNKRTLADAAVDGVIPSKKIPSPETLFKKSQEALREWKERVGQGKIFLTERKDLFFPLRAEIVEKLSRKLGDFSEMNRKWSTQNSKTTHTILQKNPEDWYYSDF